jgi:MoxR-like ATPase
MAQAHRPPSKLRLPQKGLRGRDSAYFADPAARSHAANTALGLGMPLLLTGEPGCGKSDFAWAAANYALGPRPAGLRECQVRSDSRARDLLYHYDALIRFADAQAQAPRARDPRYYVSLRPLGVALMSRGRRQVVRIDEIDKAPRDLPNDLLLELDEGNFEIPEIGDFEANSTPIHDRKHPDIELCRDMVRPKSAARPLVIITSNAERQLPEPFLRRCIFFDISFPDPDRLKEILLAHWPGAAPDPLYIDDMLVIFSALRAQELSKKPSTSELLNWAHALDDLGGQAPALLRPFRAGIDVATQQLHGPHWSELPGLPCLIKLREDLAKVG